MVLGFFKDLFEKKGIKMKWMDLILIEDEFQEVFPRNDGVITLFRLCFEELGPKSC